MDDLILTERIRSLVGSHFNYLGKTWLLIEVLTDEGKLVLADAAQNAPIQVDQYGQPLRRAPETLLIPLFDADSEAYSEELLEILANKL